MLAALLLLVIGYAGGVLTPMLTRPAEASVDAGYARDMSRHHGQAVEMAMFAFQKGSTDDIRTLAYDMATTQQYQIGMMQTWLTDDWNLAPTGDHPAMSWMPDGQRALLPDGRMPGMASDAELNKLKGSSGKDFDILWCQLMLRHHLGGTHMSEVATKKAEEPRVREMAQKILTSQTYEISVLNEKLKGLGAQPLST